VYYGGWPFWNWFYPPPTQPVVQVIPNPNYYYPSYFYSYPYYSG
jgi:hypothetical protein